MTLIENICKRIINAIKKNTKDIDQEKLEIIYYGLYIFFSDILKTAIILSIAFILGITSYVIVFLIFFGVFRGFAGGVHSKTWLGCLVTNSLITYSIVYLSMFLSFASPIVISFAILPLTLSIVYFYAPADHENKPVVSKKHRRKLKLISYFILILENITSMFFLSQPYSNILVLGNLAVVLSMLPITYKITRNRHSCFKDDMIN